MSNQYQNTNVDKAKGLIAISTYLLSFHGYCLRNLEVYNLNNSTRTSKTRQKEEKMESRNEKILKFLSNQVVKDVYVEKALREKENKTRKELEKK